MKDMSLCLQETDLGCVLEDLNMKITSKKKLTKFGYIRNFAATVHKNCTSSLSDGAA